MGRYNRIRDAILTCAQKLTRVSLIYRTKPTTKKWKTEKVKIKKTDTQKYRQTVRGRLIQVSSVQFMCCERGLKS